MSLGAEQKYSHPASLELVSAIPFPQDLNILSLFTNYGPIETYATADGGQLTIFPTCTVSLDRLLASNWETPINVGNSRLIKYIKSPKHNNDGLFVKSPERYFTQDLPSLYRGKIWYGGAKSGHKPLFFRRNPIIEQQTLFEALILLELCAKDIPAEIPQAILLNKIGEYSLITAEIPTTSQLVKLKGPRYDELFELVNKKTTIIPVDFNRTNCLEDLDGQLHIIDVNRWLWPPFTNSYREKLQTEIITAVQTLHKSR